MRSLPPESIRNIAVIAHVDHGKTTLVDALLKQSHIFRENQKIGEFIMDSNELERERGITILAKNTAVTYRSTKINIIDTPGHADFSGEVERVINMADGVLLVVDAVDGPMPQTEFVLREALSHHLKPIVVINKIDRSQARVAVVERLVQDLFLLLAVDSDQLDYPVLYASAKEGYALAKMGDEPKSIEPLLEAIVRQVPPPKGNSEEPFQLQVANLDYHPNLGPIAIGRIFHGSISPGERLFCAHPGGDREAFTVTRVFLFHGLGRTESEAASAGDIAAIAGVEQVSIGDVIVHPQATYTVASIVIQEPTVKMTFGANTSPFAGQEGKFVTAGHLRTRLTRELRTNVSLRVQDTENPEEYMVAGRGELHLAILIETMRREGYEFQVSKPEAITAVINGQLQEPYEKLVLMTKDEHIGSFSEELASRRAEMQDMQSDGSGNVTLTYRVPTRGLLGFRSLFLRSTRGYGVMNTLPLGYELYGAAVRSTRQGTLIAAEGGTAVAFGLANAQERGLIFVDAGTKVYEGMIIGIHAKDADLAVNVCKTKKLTNMRSSTSDIAVKLIPPAVMSLEDFLDFIAEDELLEVTPLGLRARKRILAFGERERARKSGRGAEARA